MPAQTITVDTQAAEADFDRIAASLESGFEATFREIGKRAGRSVDENFLRRGRPDIWKSLAPATIDARSREAAKTGKQPVAGVEAPLRVTDALRKAASASEPGMEGSEIALGPFGWSNTLTLPYAAIQDQGGTVHIDRLFGLEGRSATIDIPARPYFFFQDGDADDFVALLLTDLHGRIESAIESD